MARITCTEAGGQNVCAFLDMIAHSELGAALLARTDDGYNVIVGSSPAKPITFSSYASHPNQLIKPPVIPVPSTAAGRYQLLSKYFATYQQQLHLPDFSPVSQDLIAIQQIRERKALASVVSGQFDQAVALCASCWASLPGAKYGQHTNTLAVCRQWYLAAGGQIA